MYNARQQIPKKTTIDIANFHDNELKKGRATNLNSKHNQKGEQPI